MPVTYDSDTFRAVDLALKGAASNSAAYDAFYNVVVGAIPSPSLLIYKTAVQSPLVVQLTGGWTRIGTNRMRLASQVISSTAAVAITGGQVDHYEIKSGSRFIRLEPADLTFSGSIPSGAYSIRVGDIDIVMPIANVQQQNDNFVAGSPPGSGWTTELASTSPGIVIPNDFTGMTRDVYLAGDPYPFKMTRSHAIDVETAGNGGLLLFQVNPARNSFTKTMIDKWIADTPGKTRMWNAGDYGNWAAKYNASSNPQGRTGPWGEAYSNSALKDPVYAYEATKWLYQNYTATQIPIIEVRNEPNFGAPTSTTSFYNGSNTCFYFGTATELAAEAAEVRRAVNEVAPGVIVLACGFSMDGGDVGHMAHIKAFADAGGLNHCHGLGYHAYMYSNNPDQASIVGKGVRGWLDNNGYPGYPIWMTEAGHEFNPATNYTDQQVADSYVRHCIRTAAVGAKCHIAFKDTGSLNRTMRDPNSSALIQAAFTVTNGFNGKTLRQFATHPDGRVWWRFSDNTEGVR